MAQVPRSGPLHFEVVSIHPVERDKVRSFDFSDFTSRHYFAHPSSLTSLIQSAYHVERYQIRNRPDWADTRFYSVDAKVEGDTPPTEEQTREMLQNLLNDYFVLRLHHETTKMQGYELLPAKGGLKIKASTEPESKSRYLMPGNFQMGMATTSSLATMLSYLVKAPVEDKSGFTGTASFDFKFAPLDSMDSTEPSLFTVLEEKFGLILQKKMVSVDSLVFDSANQNPSTN